MRNRQVRRPELIPPYLMCLRCKTPNRHMKLSIRIDRSNPNHHLWNNHGTWCIHYVIHPTPFTKERVRQSLGTTCLEHARRVRDFIFCAAAQFEGGAA